MRGAVPRGDRKRDRRRLATQVGGGRHDPRLGPPRVADEMLTSYRQPCQRLDIARIARQRCQVPTLRLGRQLRAHALLQRVRRPRQRFGDPVLHACVEKGASARRLEQQYMKLSGYPPSDPRLDRCEFFRTELMSPRPDELGGRGIDDPHIHPQSFPITALSAPGNDIVIFTV